MSIKKIFSLPTIIFFLLSLTYLGMELIFNTRLLDISSSVRSGPDQVEPVLHFGRVASGIGFTLLVIGLFQRFGFRIAGSKQWLVFSAVAFLCLLPFIACFGQVLFGLFADDGASYLDEIVWSIIPFIGIFLIIRNKGRTPFVVVLGLIIMAWPTMFYGQKLAVEHYLISTTTAQERLDANYILLLRTGVEDCILPLEGVSLCDKDGGADIEKRSVRSLLGAIFTLNPSAVFSSLDPEQGRIIDRIATQGLWFSPREYYRLSLQRVAEERKHHEAFLEAYYQGYKKASDTYLAKSNAPKAAKDQAWKQVQAKYKADIAPGLSRTEFFRFLNIPALPPMEALTVPENEFMQKYIIPMNRKASFDALEDIRRKAPSYVNGGEMAEEGKDYIRMLYIPAIALCVSLFLVVLTIGRNLVNGLCFAAPKLRLMRPVAWSVFLAGVLVLPYLWPNAYVASPAYKKYLSLAKDRSAVPAIVLDWVVHAQPIIYRAGSALR